MSCKDYHNRPDGCRTFNCTWIDGHGNYEDNPKLCGVLIQKKETNLAYKGEKLKYVAWETKIGGFKSESGLQAMTRVCEETGGKIIMLDLGSNNKIVGICIVEEAA